MFVKQLSFHTFLIQNSIAQNEKDIWPVQMGAKMKAVNSEVEPVL